MDEQTHLSQMHPWLMERIQRALVVWRAGAAPGESLRVVESVRPLDVQRGYYAAGKSRADGVTAFSQHQFAPALACDVAAIRAGKYVASAADPAWRRWAEAVEAEGLESGLRWKFVDAPHAQVQEADRVRLVQQALGLTADGVWGKKTDAAVAAAVAPLALRPGKQGWARMSLQAWAALNRGSP